MSDNLIYVMPVKGDEDWDQELACLGHSIFSSLRYTWSGASKDGEFFVLRNVSTAHPLIFFRIYSYRIEILQLCSKFSSSDIHIVCQHIFNMFGQIRCIGFDCVESDREEIGFVAQRYNVSEDFVIDLCGSVARYTSMLGRQLQHDLKRYKKKLSTASSDVRYACFSGQDVAEAVFNEIIGLSASRMAAKEVASSHTLEKSRRLFDLVKNFGFLSVIYIDGIVRAGVICTRYGTEMFMHVVAHDTGFDRFRLGKLACYFSICAAIESGVLRYHLLSGWYDYKLRFLGKPVEFDRVEVYRSAGAVFFCLRRYLAIFYRGNGRRVKRYLKLRGSGLPGRSTEGPGVLPFLGRMVGPVRWLWRGG